MDIKEALDSISDHDDWTRADDVPEWSCTGECADGVPDWRIYKSVCGGYVVTREIGWYKQIGDAQDEADIVRVARAMDAADRALSKYLSDHPSA